MLFRSLRFAVLFLSGAAAFGQTVVDSTYFQDVLPQGTPASGYFTWIQLAKRLGIAVPSATGPCANPGGGTPIIQPPGAGGTTGMSQLVCPYFGPDAVVTRAEMAYWIVRSQMDEPQIGAYLCATGGDSSGTAVCGSAPGGINSSSFGDVGPSGSAIVNPFLAGTVTNAQLVRDIEVMARRGYTKGCTATGGPIFRYCPNDPVTRAEMAVFLIRAKMNNVFPTSLSGGGDNFQFVATPYFTDVQPGDPVYGAYFKYIQEMRELGITQGTSPTTYSPASNVTRKEIAVFTVRAFFL